MQLDKKRHDKSIADFTASEGRFEQLAEGHPELLNEAQIRARARLHALEQLARGA
jgi:hypothetical protein